MADATLVIQARDPSIAIAAKDPAIIRLGLAGPTGPAGPMGPPRSYARVFTAATSGGDWISPQAAVAALTDAGPTNRYLVRVAPGNYVGQLVMKPYIDVGGLLDSGSVVLQSSSDTEHLVVGAAHSLLHGVALEGPAGVGYAAADYTGTGGAPFFLEKIYIRKGYYGVHSHPATYGNVHCTFVVNEYAGTRIEQFLRASAAGNVTGILCSYMNGASAKVGTTYRCEGPSSSMNLKACDSLAPGSDCGVYADDGATVRLWSCDLHKGTNALRIGPNGATKASLIDASGGVTISSENYPEDVGVDSPVGTVYLFGRSDPSQHRQQVPNQIRGAVVDPRTGKFTVLGELETGALHLEEAGIAVGTVAPSDPTTFAQWEADHQGHWCWYDIT